MVPCAAADVEDLAPGRAQVLEGLVEELLDPQEGADEGGRLGASEAWQLLLLAVLPTGKQELAVTHLRDTTQHVYTRLDGCPLKPC